MENPSKEVRSGVTHLYIELRFCPLPGGQLAQQPTEGVYPVRFCRSVPPLRGPREAPGDPGKDPVQKTVQLAQEISHGDQI